MRLTKYKPSDESMFPYKLKDEELSTELDGVHKLGQLEDIEEELGIDLITLFKAFENGIWIKFNMGSRTYNWKTGETKETGDQVVFHKAPYKILAENIAYFRRLFEKEYTENYGKTWALTKEELEWLYRSLFTKK